MKRKDVDNVHDKGFKEFYNRKEAIIDLVENVLNLNFGEKLKGEHLTLIDTKSYYDELKEQESDVVYLIKVDEKEILLYLFLELQSTIDYRMPARLLFYMIGQLQRYYLDQKYKPSDKNMKLPVIYPVVLYNGKTPWNVSTTLRPLFKNESLFGEGILDFKYDILDINNGFSKEELQLYHGLNGIMFFLEQKMEPVEFLERVHEIVPSYNKLEIEEKGILRRWIYATFEDTLAQAASDILKSKEGTNLISNNANILKEMKEKEKLKGIEIGTEKGIEIGTEKGIEIGTEKGIEIGTEKGIVIGTEKGIQIGTVLGETKVIIRQLTKRLGNLSETMINSIQGLSSLQLEKLEDEMFECQTLEDLELILTKLNA